MSGSGSVGQGTGAGFAANGLFDGDAPSTVKISNGTGGGFAGVSQENFCNGEFVFNLSSFELCGVPIKVTILKKTCNAIKTIPVFTVLLITEWLDPVR